MYENIPETDDERLEELMEDYGKALLVGSQRRLHEIEQEVLATTVWKHFEDDDPIGVAFSMKEYIRLCEALGDDDEARRTLERALMRELG